MSSLIGLSGTILQSNGEMIPFQQNVERYNNYVIKQCICNTVQLRGDFISTAVSLFSLPLAGMAFEHPFMVLKAEDLDEDSTIYLVAQAARDSLKLAIAENEEEANELGKEGGHRTESASHRNIHTFEPENTTTVNDVIGFMERENVGYNALSNNCQHFVSKFAREFGDSSDVEIIERGSRGTFTAMVREEGPAIRRETSNFSSRTGGFRDYQDMGDGDRSCVDQNVEITCSIS